MDQRLSQAAWNGDVDHLLKEIETNPSILHAAALEGGENPLHIACLAGHLDFVETVVKLWQSFTSELNQDGFSPLHASAYGHVNIVKELLKVDFALCLIEGKDRKVPLHLAVVRGKVEVIKELILSDLDSIECTTAQGETSLHLAVKNHQFKSFQVLVHHLKQLNKEDFLNSKDIHWNTVLHLAVSRKQYEVVHFLLNGQAISMEKLELNSLHNSDLTPYDMLLMFQSEAGDREIEELLIQAGALKAENLQNSGYTQEQTPNQADRRLENNSLSPTKRLLDYFKYIISKTLQAKLYLVHLEVLGKMIMFHGPAGNFTLASPNNDMTALKNHTAGEAIMGTHKPGAYTLFLVANSLGFYTSLHMITVLTAAFPKRLELHLLMFALVTTYATCMGAIAPNPSIAFAFMAISISLPFMIPIITTLYRNYLQRLRCVSPYTGQESV